MLIVSVSVTVQVLNSVGRRAGMVARYQEPGDYYAAALVSQAFGGSSSDSSIRRCDSDSPVVSSWYPAFGAAALATSAALNS